MKKKFSRYMSTLLTLLILILFGLYLYRNPEILTTLGNIKPSYILLMMFFFLLIFLLEGLFIKVTLSIFNKPITVKESFYLSTISRIGNYLLPMRAGAIFRATYLKKKYNFDYSKFLSTLYGYYIILFLLYSILGIFSLLIKNLIYDQRFTILTLFFIALFISMLILMFVRIPFEKIIKKEDSFLGKIVLFLEKFMKSWDTIVKNRKLLNQLLLITLGNIVINTVIILVEFLSLNISVNIFDLLLYSSLSGVSLLISLTPGSLGIREGVFLISSQSIGLSQEQILQLAVLDRGILFVLLFIMILFIFMFLKEFKLRDIFFAKEKD